VKPAETIIPMGKGRSLIVILAAIAGVVLTLRLGGWQLSRADEKIQYQSQLEAQMRLPPLDTRSLQQNPEQWLNVHRRVELFGTWWRGWVARDPVDATKAAPIQTPTQPVRLEGRISAGLSHMTELKATTAGPSQVGELLIRSNLDRQTMQAMVTEQVSAVVVQTGANSDGLSRDWPVVSGSADKNKGYAFQWFALSGLIALLFIWFQWIGPWRHAKQQS